MRPGWRTLDFPAIRSLRRLSTRNINPPRIYIYPPSPTYDITSIPLGIEFLLFKMRVWIQQIVKYVFIRSPTRDSPPLDDYLERGQWPVPVTTEHSCAECPSFKRHIKSLQQELRETRSEARSEQQKTARLLTETQSEVTRLRDSLARYEQHLSRAKSEIQTLHRELGARHHDYEAEKEQLSRNCARLKDELDALRTAHVKAIHSVGTGLEPVLDSKLTERFTTLNTQLNGWSRKAYIRRGKKLLDVPSCVSFPNCVESMVWSELYWWIFFAIFPEYLEKVENHLRAADITGLKVEYWRAYTAGLLSQHPDRPGDLEAMTKDTTDHICQRLHTELDIEFQQNAQYHLHEIILSSVKLADDLRCQRAFYEPENISRGQEWDPVCMDDVNGVVDEDDVDQDSGVGEASQWVVALVLSAGWVKRTHRGSPEVIERLCKSRVVLMDKNEKHENEDNVL
ncbi:hypothetical protein EDC01DRAFT_638388 [Geopyxis carbonaria]|nr:hypothetical protein EDC01DRAFT_638388 [Geopyxis carbonaria]